METVADTKQLEAQPKNGVAYIKTCTFPDLREKTAHFHKWGEV